MKQDKPIEKTYKYWNSSQETPDPLFGVYPMGRGGILEVFYRHYLEVQHIKQQIMFNKNMNLLELGSGNGRWITAIAPLVKHYDAVDFSHHAIEIARESIVSLNLNNVNLIEESVIDFYSSRKYDVIIFSGITQYLQDDEIRKIIRNISPCLTNNTIIIDRSTINYKKREILQSHDYYSIFRTPSELQNIFSDFGFVLTYQKRSYTFLRGGKMYLFKPIYNIFLLFAKILGPFFFEFLHFFSLMADLIYPIPFEGGDRSHDFFIFRKMGNHEKK